MYIRGPKKQCVVQALSQVCHGHIFSSKQAAFSGPIVWLRKTVLLLVKSWSSAVVTKIRVERTFETFSSFIISTQCLYALEYSLLDLYDYIFDSLFLLSDFCASHFFDQNFYTASIVYSMKRYPSFVSFDLFIYILKVTDVNFMATGFDLNVQACHRRLGASHLSAQRHRHHLLESVARSLQTILSHLKRTPKLLSAVKLHHLCASKASRLPCPTTFRSPPSHDVSSLP